MATTADVGNLLATGNMTNTVDEVVLSALDRVLVKDQTDAKQNGIYSVVTAGTGSNGTWVRARDANASDKMTSGMTTVVSEGSTNAFKTFKLATSDPITLGTTELSFVNPFVAGAGTVVGPNGSVQFNDLGTAGGTSGLLFDKTSNLLSINGNVSSSGYFIGDGSQLTGIVAGTNYGDSNVAAYLPTHTGNISANYFLGNIITAAGTVEGALFSENSILNVESGTSNLRIYSSGDVAISTNGTANAVVIGANTTITGNLLPSANVTYDLGSPTQRWRTGYFAANTIDLGGSTISIDPVNGFTFSAAGLAPVALSGDSSVTADIANLYANAGVQAGEITTANTAMKGYVDAADTALSNQIAGANAAIITANTAMKGYVDATITANISALINGSPATLDTLNEIAAALGNDANLSVTLTNQIAGVQGNVTAANLAIATANTAMKGYVDGQISTTTSAITTANTAMKGYVDSVANLSSYSDANVSAYLPTYTGNISANVITSNLFIGNGSQLTGLPAGYSNADVATYLPTYSGNISAANVNVSGNLTVNGTMTATNIVESSSETLKENINPITDALALISQLQGVTYDRRDGSTHNEAGLIAEEVNRVLPNLVALDDQGRPLGVQYTKLTAYLIEAVKSLKLEIDRLKGS